MAFVGFISSLPQYVCSKRLVVVVISLPSIYFSSHETIFCVCILNILYIPTSFNDLLVLVLLLLS
jgi:hypothetical protein